MDLAKLKSTAGAVCTVKNPIDGTDTEIKITLFGPESTQYRAAMLHTARIDTKGDPVKKPEDMTEQDILAAVEKDDALKVSILVMCTGDWQGLEENGKSIKYSRKEAERIYSEYVWLRNQIWVWLNSQSNFFIK